MTARQEKYLGWTSRSFPLYHANPARFNKPRTSGQTLWFGRRLCRLKGLPIYRHLRESQWTLHDTEMARANGDPPKVTRRSKTWLYPPTTLPLLPVPRKCDAVCFSSSRSTSVYENLNTQNFRIGLGVAFMKTVAVTSQVSGVWALEHNLPGRVHHPVDGVQYYVSHGEENPCALIYKIRRLRQQEARLDRVPQVVGRIRRVFCLFLSRSCSCVVRSLQDWQ